MCPNKTRGNEQRSLRLVRSPRTTACVRGVISCVISPSQCTCARASVGEHRQARAPGAEFALPVAAGSCACNAAHFATSPKACGGHVPRDTRDGQTHDLRSFAPKRIHFSLISSKSNNTTLHIKPTVFIKLYEICCRFFF